jgi:hypothetical protein
MPYDTKLRARFAAEVDDHLYGQHQTFLSNPLLATMMLMTYDQFAHIPAKIHIFYQQAFETLFLKHDAVKGAGFRRKMQTALDINDFRNCLSALSIRSYTKQKFEFSEDELLDYIKKAIEFEKRTEVRAVDYIDDLLKSVCVLQRDGLHIVFSHRSFQEYFSAYFISRNPSVPPISDLLEMCLHRPEDNVISMAFEINRDLIEREWVLPRIGKLKDQLVHCDPNQDFEGYCEIVYDRRGLEGFITSGTMIICPSYMPFVRVLRDLYAEKFTVDSSHSMSTDEAGEIAAMLNFTTIKHGVVKVHIGESYRKWAYATSFKTYVQEEYKSLLSLAEIVKNSVSEQEKLGGALFE